MKRIIKLFNKLTAYNHFLVFLIILTVMKIANVFITEGTENGLHFAGLGVGLIVISSVLHIIFTRLFNKKKKYLHSMISTFLIILMLSHADPEPIRGIMVILLLYVSKFLVTYKGKNIFNPVVFTIGVITLISLATSFIGIPPMDFTGIDIRFPIAGLAIPLPLLPILLALIFNVKRVKKHPLAISYIAMSLLLGFLFNVHAGNIISFTIITFFIGAAVIVEPKTSPSNKNQQMFYGIIMAIIVTIFSLLKIPNAIVIAFLIGNIGYFIINNRA